VRVYRRRRPSTRVPTATHLEDPRLASYRHPMGDLDPLLRGSWLLSEDATEGSNSNRRCGSCSFSVRLRQNRPAGDTHQTENLFFESRLDVDASPVRYLPVGRCALRFISVNDSAATHRRQRCGCMGSDRANRWLVALVGRGAPSVRPRTRSHVRRSSRGSTPGLDNEPRGLRVRDCPRRRDRGTG